MANGTRIEKLDDSNYESWKMDVESLLIYDDLWEYTSGETLKPAEEKNASVWITKDRKARACILLALSKSQKSSRDGCENFEGGLGHAAENSPTERTGKKNRAISAAAKI